MKKNIHLDLGTHFGQGLREIIDTIKINQDWLIYSFESNPITFQEFKNNGGHNQFPLLNINYINKAVGTKNANITVNLETAENTKRPNGMASTTIGLDEWSPWEGIYQNRFKETRIVECIDFSDFVEKLDSDSITCKMDIEGAEFDILEKMIQDNTINKIHKIWIEFHDHFFLNKELYANRKNNIIKYLQKSNIDIHIWQ